MIISAALSRQVFTLEDVQQLQLELQSVLDALAEGRSVPQTLRKLPAHFSLTPTEQADHAAAGKAVERIIRTLQSLPVIRLSVPYYPTRSQVEELAVLVKNATTPNTVITVQTDITLLAGTRLETDTQKLSYTLVDTCADTLRQEFHV